MSDPIHNPPHYTAYPVQPIEISRHLGFCLGNAVKYVLRAPYKGGIEDCNKALVYLEWEKEIPQAPIPHLAYLCILDAIETLCGYLNGTGGDALWDDISGTQHEFLHKLDAYLEDSTENSLETMIDEVNTLSEILRLRGQAGGIYDGCKGKPQTCRACGCKDSHACEGGCYWVKVDLCSACAEKGAA